MFLKKLKKKIKKKKKKKPVENTALAKIKPERMYKCPHCGCIENALSKLVVGGACINCNGRINVPKGAG